MRASLFDQAIQIKNMVGVNVGDENLFHLEPVACREIQHRLTIGPSVKNRRLFRRGIPYEEGIHCHVVEDGIEVSKALDVIHRGSCVAALSQRQKRIGSQTENRRNFAKGGLIQCAGFEIFDLRNRCSRLGRERLVVEGMPALGLSNDVTKAVFQWYTDRHVCFLISR